MIRLAAICPGSLDATSFYRGYGPLQAMEHAGLIDLHLLPEPEVNWAYLRGVDILYVQRPFRKEHEAAIRLAKAMNRKVWVDYDDLATEVPLSNGVFELYQSKTTQQVIYNALALADAISVSTPFIAKRWDLGKKARIIPNAWDDEIFPRKLGRMHDGKAVCWRGGASHDEDMFAYQDAMAEAAETRKDWEWYFLGHPFWKTLECIGRVIRPKIVRAGGIMKYFQSLSQLQALVQQVPLANHNFNRSKSNIAWIEASWAGSVTLAPDWEEWQRPGMVTYKDAFDYRDKLLAMTSGEMDLEKLNAESWEYIESELRLSKINQQRMELLQAIA